MGVKGKGGDFRNRVVDEAKKEGLELERSVEQQKLLDDEAPAPSVQGGKMLAKYVKPVFSMENEDRVVELEFSISLSDAHKDLLDEGVLTAWKFIERNHPKRIIGIEIPHQTVDLFLAPDDSAELHLTAAEVRQVKLSSVEKTGDGKIEKIMRLQFRLLAELSKNVTLFATTQYGNALWIKMEPAQGVLAGV